MDFITREELQKVLAGDPAPLNEAMSRLFNKSIEGSMRHVPEIINQLVKKTSVMNKMSERFFTENPEFKQHSDIVADTITQLEGQHPGWDYEKLLAEATPIINKKIGLSKTVGVSSLQSTPNKPKLLMED